ncbi:MAG: ABC transporter permease [Actinobacteria bacterium]|nr:ABC transporter permease [Actinomycetota bacterium]
MRILRSAAGTGRGRWGLGLTVLILAIALIGPFVTPDDPNAVGLTGTFAAPGPGHVLGGDVLGRDVLSRVLAGGWVLIGLAAISTAVGVVLGTIGGMAAAYLPGWRDGLIMRGVDVLLAFPQLVFALLLVSVLGDHLYLVVLAVGLSHAPQVARVIRSTALEVAERDYVKAVAVMGVSPWKVMVREILPNLISPLMVETGLRLTYSIIIMAGLAFLGFGFQPPDATWGYMIRENQIGVTSNPWGVVAPAVLLALLTIGVNTFTDAVARVALGVDRAEMVAVTEAAGSSEG